MAKIFLKYLNRENCDRNVCYGAQGHKFDFRGTSLFEDDIGTLVEAGHKLPNYLINLVTFVTNTKIHH